MEFIILMEEAFAKLRGNKNNSVDNLVKWMKDSKLIDSSKEAEDKARKLFDDCKDASNVELGKFKQAVAKLAEEQKKSVEQFTKMLSEEGPKMLNAVIAGASAGASAAATAAATAFQDALKKK